MISVAEDFDLHFRFFRVGTAFAEDDSLSSSADVDPALAVGSEETV